MDLRSAHAEIAAEVAAGFDRVMSDAVYVGGAEVRAFEREYARFCGAPHCVGVGNGTDALELALRALGVGPGREVILPANTFIATAEAVARSGARPVLVDCDPATHLIDTDAALAAVTPATAAVVPVHLYGQPAAVERLVPAGVPIVEDAAQSHGATRFGRQAGASGVATTSFYPGKNLGAYGDAGAVVTADPEVADRVRVMASHGSRTPYVHEVAGCNSRLDALQAVVLRTKLTRLRSWNLARQAAAARYDALLDGLGVRRPTVAPGNTHVWHLYVVRVPGGRRDHVRRRLLSAGIATGIHYPVPVHLTPAFAGLGHRRGAFPHAEAAAAEILSLPMHPHLTAGQQEDVVKALAAALADA
ncbi:DegT/DnrJ/EryC1/StrS family aminotransferase [Spirilliplanes yamanashiensis]|uniref:DegT/DnrJ/EryC1/StrS family aminotransferase n=1 Tax=Spirilliplanes yamanashiensis TaxID=42233 RepID=UPI001EF1DBF4|nr:DegT/DnrJ/EryC1/StrS family aminotransferase [Spirilliplanes yamanashiensis]MDP9818195.1 dTDP-4-amino-4,6-dideoxygalactose transaminase [Spirilliplanes yamanashiensis]